MSELQSLTKMTFLKFWLLFMLMPCSVPLAFVLQCASAWQSVWVHLQWWIWFHVMQLSGILVPAFMALA